MDDEDLLGDKKASKGGSGSTGVTSAGRGVSRKSHPVLAHNAENPGGFQIIFPSLAIQK